MGRRLLRSRLLRSAWFPAILILSNECIKQELRAFRLNRSARAFIGDGRKVFRSDLAIDADGCEGICPQTGERSAN